MLRTRAVKALLVLATLHRDGAITFVGAVCNGGGQPEKRARLARCLLDKLGVPDVPVAIGSHGQPYDAQPHEYALSGFDAVDASRLRPASELVLSILQTSEPGALTVVLISSLRDFADAILAYPQLVRRAVGSVSVMGGLERDERARFGWAADSSVNNGFDMAGAQAVYDWCFAEGVPLAVVSRFAVPLLPMSLARSFAERSNSDVLRYLAEAQFLGLEGLWHKLCAGKLPARCTKQVRAARHRVRPITSPRPPPLGRPHATRPTASARAPHRRARRAVRSGSARPSAASTRRSTKRRVSRRGSLSLIHI